jgi:predicted porin
MKKVLYILALTTLVSAVQAETLSDTGSVRFYGVLDQSVYAVNDGTGTQSGIGSLSNQTTRLGILGEDRLNGGWKSGFQLETQLAMNSGAVGSSGTGAPQTTTGTSEVFNRAANMYIGNAESGEFRLGRMATPIAGNYSRFDALQINSLGLVSYYNAGLVNSGTNKITGINGNGAIQGTNSAQTEIGFFANGVQYTSPKVYNTTITFFTSPGNNNTNALREMSGVYDQGPLQLGAGFGQAADTSGNYVFNRSLLGAAYQLGQWRLSVSQIALTYQNSTLGHNTLIRQVGVKYSVNDRWTVGTEYTTAQDTVSTNNSSRTLGVATEYALSKRTSVYGIAGRTVNNGNSAIGPIYSTSATLVSGRDVNGIATGIKYSF